MGELKFLTILFLIVGLCASATVAMEEETIGLDISVVQHPLIEQMSGPTMRAFRETCSTACAGVEEFCKMWNDQHKIMLGWKFPLSSTLLYHLNRYVIGQVYFSNFILDLSKIDNTTLLLVINRSVDPAQEIIQISQIAFQPHCSYRDFLGEEGTIEFDMDELTPAALSASQPKILAALGCSLIDQNLDASGRLLCTASLAKYKGAENHFELWRHFSLALTSNDKTTFFEKIKKLGDISHLANDVAVQEIFGNIGRIKEIEDQLCQVDEGNNLIWDTKAESNILWQELLAIDPYMTPEKIRNAMYCYNNSFVKEHPEGVVSEEDYIKRKPYFENIYSISKRLIDLLKDEASKEDASWHFNHLGCLEKFHEEEAGQTALLLMGKLSGGLQSLKNNEIVNLTTAFSYHKSGESQKRVEEIEIFLIDQKKYNFLLSLYLKMKRSQEAVELYKKNRGHFLETNGEEEGITFDIGSMLAEVASYCLFGGDTKEPLAIWEKIKLNPSPSHHELLLAITIHLMKGEKDEALEANAAYNKSMHLLGEEYKELPVIQGALISLLEGDREKAFGMLQSDSSQLSAFCLIYLKEKMDDNIVGLEQQYFVQHGSVEESKKQFYGVVNFMDLVLGSQTTKTEDHPSHDLA